MEKTKIFDVIRVISVILILFFLIGGGIIYGWLNPITMNAIFILPLSIIFWLAIIFWLIGVMDLVLDVLKYRKIK